MFQVYIKNQSTLVSDAQVRIWMAALQIQVSDHFAAAWGIDAKLHFAAKDDKLGPNDWLIVLTNTADEAGALGYHETTKSGAPIGKVFVKTTMDDGGLVSVTLSHELLELLLDPWINLMCADSSGTKIYAYEACDAVEADDLGYDIEVNGEKVRVSDFVMPNFFEPDLQTNAPRSWMGNVHKALTLAPGGYLAFLDTTDLASGWQQITARTSPKDRASRRLARRGVAAADRQASTAE